MAKENEKEYAIDKVKAPPKGHPQYDYVGGLLESVKSDFRAFGETLGFIRKDIKEVKTRADATFEEVGSMRVEMSEMNDKLDEHTERLDRIEDKLGIKEEIKI